MKLPDYRAMTRESSVRIMEQKKTAAEHRYQIYCFSTVVLRASRKMLAEPHRLVPPDKDMRLPLSASSL